MSPEGPAAGGPRVAGAAGARRGDTDDLRVGVLISGRGTNLQALAGACADEAFPATITVVISSVPDVPGLERAEAFGIETRVVDHREFDGKADFEAELDRVLREHEVELVCLAGFMRVLSAEFVGRWPDRILNIHPSLLPAFPGLHVQREAVEHGVRFSGCTVHFVVPEVDAGPIVLQAVVPVEQDDTEETLADRILQQEHLVYPQAVRLFAEGRLRIEGRRVRILEPGTQG